MKPLESQVREHKVYVQCTPISEETGDQLGFQRANTKAPSCTARERSVKCRKVALMKKKSASVIKMI